MNLTTRYLGLELSSPLVASASPLSATIDGVRALEDAGVGAVVLYSLFEEQLTLERDALTRLLTDKSYAEALVEKSESKRLSQSPLDYLKHVTAAREAVKVPIVASINGGPHPEWANYARLLEDAGASAVEVNLYFVTTDVDLDGSEVEERYIDTIASVTDGIDIPVAVKLSPYFSNVGNFAKRVVAAGASGLVLFNRFYQPDIDITRRRMRPALELSRSHELRLPLRWTGILRDRIDASLAITTGVHSSDDVIKSILVGADVVMLCGVLLERGVDYVKTLQRGLEAWMAGEDVNRLDEVRGALCQARNEHPEVFERAQYIRTLESAS